MQGPTLGVHFMESQLKGVKKGGNNCRCPFYGESTERSKERQGPTLGVHFMKSQLK